MRSLFNFYFSCILARSRLKQGVHSHLGVHRGHNNSYVDALATYMARGYNQDGAGARVWWIGGDGGVWGGCMPGAARGSLKDSRPAVHPSTLAMAVSGGRRRRFAMARLQRRRRGPVRKSCAVFLWPQRIPGPALGTVVSLALTTMRTAWCPFMPQTDQPRGPFWTQRVWYLKVDRRSLGRERGAS